MSDQIETGGCFCGEVRYEVPSQLRNLCLCHCESCRKAAGAPFVAWGTIDRKDLKLYSGELAIYKSSAGVERGACNKCGTSLTYWSQSRGNEIDITLASLDQAEKFRPCIQIFVEDKLNWIETNPDLPKYDTVPGKE
ncbi:MAG: GFA family protein [Pseudomonadales bacterium]|nr:GFA family protein [Pseudomonadales bacterium]